MSVAPVLLILGAGTNIGAGIARVFASNGYKIALAARKLQDGLDSSGTLHVHTDLAQPESVASVFEKVSKALGVPAVVVYNAASVKAVPAKSPLDLSLEDHRQDFTVNTTSVLAAAKEAVKGFETLPDSSSKTFIFTGNILNTEPILPLFSLGIGKSATAHMIWAASLAYRGRGYKFYYADERNMDGTVAGGSIDGAAHGDFYLQLASGKEQEPWLATFVKNKGYVSFPGIGYVKAAEAP